MRFFTAVIRKFIENNLNLFRITTKFFICFCVLFKLVKRYRNVICSHIKFYRNYKRADNNIIGVASIIQRKEIAVHEIANDLFR